MKRNRYNFEYISTPDLLLTRNEVFVHPISGGFKPRIRSEITWKKYNEYKNVLQHLYLSRFYVFLRNFEFVIYLVFERTDSIILAPAITKNRL